MDLDGTVLGQYHIIEQIGRGGMATVYKAYQPNLDRYVAVKVLAPDMAETKGFITRFEREAKAVARLRHRNTLTVFDYGRQGDLFYLVMEYVSGGTLIGRMGWPQDLAYAVNIVSQVGDALAHAHRQGMIHRDVKPGNILMAEEDWPLLSDFGLVKIAEDSLHLTTSGASVGTPQYMSPEQARGLVVDQRSDIYSLGVVLYEAVTGRPPFGTDNPVVVLLRHINEPITPPHTLRSDLPEEIERVICKALAKSPAERYQRMEDFLTDLRGAHPLHANHNLVQQGDAQIVSKKPSTRPSIPPRRRSLLWVGVAIGAALLVTLAMTLPFLKASTIPSLPHTPTSPPLPSPTVAPVTPTAPTIEQRVWEADGAEMVFVPAGEFIMGSEELGDDERPVHRVYLDDFWIDRYEVTNERFARFVAATGYQTEAERHGWGWVSLPDVGGEKVEGADWRHPRGPDSSIEPSGYAQDEDKMDHPVVLVSWNDADAYCRWAGKRLPSEAQWEKAARGPLTLEQDGDSGRGNCYAWGNEFDSARANTRESERGDTTPVGSFSPQGDSPYGACDMTGNAWEWVADWYDSDTYSQAPYANPTGPATGTYKVLRGGSWPFDEVYARTSFRYNVRPDYTYDFAGFRCSSQ